VVIPLLNGIDIAERVGKVVGMEHMLGGLARVSAKLERPGVVRHVSWGVLMFGELQGGISPRGEAILAAMREARTRAELLPDIRRELWSKFVQNATGAVCTVMRCPPAQVVRDPDTRALAIACLRETEAVARRQGIALEADICEQVMSRAEALSPEMKPSMLLDLEQGRPLELENVTGVVVRLGKELGVETPVNRFIYAALKLHADGAR
jgi:2-dehydropantoate 2-reductase